ETSALALALTCGASVVGVAEGSSDSETTGGQAPWGAVTATRAAGLAGCEGRSSSGAGSKTGASTSKSDDGVGLGTTSRPSTRVSTESVGFGATLVGATGSGFIAGALVASTGCWLNRARAAI